MAKNISVKILKLGHASRTVEAKEGETVDSLLTRLRVPTGGHSLSVNAQAVATSTAVLADGDIVTLNPKVEGGN
jgi:sulfur carrier protein ThiS